MATSPRLFSRLSVLLMAAAASTLVACSGDTDDRLARDLAPPQRVDVLAPPVAPDPAQMHPALQVARARGVKTNVYFNEELQQAVARMQGMEETLGRLQNDLQGTAMAMQRVEMIRQELEALNVRFQSLQERLMYAGPQIAPLPETVSGGPAAVDAQPMMAEADVPHAMRPTPLMGDMVSPDSDHAAQISKPVLDETPAPAAKPATQPKSGSGVVDVRVGAHPDKMRIVLDVNGDATGMTANVDTAEKLLTVELPKAAWDAAQTQSFKGNPLLASYTAQPSGKGSVVAFTLKGETKILNSSVLKAADGKPARVVIDLAK